MSGAGRPKTLETVSGFRVYGPTPKAVFPPRSAPIHAESGLSISTTIPGSRFLTASFSICVPAVMNDFQVPAEPDDTSVEPLKKTRKP